MFTLARIKPLGLGAPFGFDMPSFEMPSFDLTLPPGPLFPGGGLPLAPGSGNGGGGGVPPPPPPAGGGAPAAPPGEGMQPALPGYYPQPTYLFPVQEQQAPAPQPGAPAPAPSQAVPTWAIATGVGLAALVVGSLLWRR